MRQADREWARKPTLFEKKRQKPSRLQKCNNAKATISARETFEPPLWFAPSREICVQRQRSSITGFHKSRFNHIACFALVPWNSFATPEIKARKTMVNAHKNVSARIWWLWHTTLEIGDVLWQEFTAANNARKLFLVNEENRNANPSPNCEFYAIRNSIFLFQV